MNKFLQELQRRNVLKASLSYVIISWVVLQVAAIVFPIIGFSTSTMRILLLILVIAFPFWVIFAYLFELTPTGFKKTSEVAPEKSINQSTSKRLNAFIIGGLSLAVVLLVVDRIFNITYTPNVSNIEKSIAVLPFTNLSNDPDQEYFSDGLTDDILTQLAKIDEFKVISRTSVMQYKNNTLSIKEIAAQLGVGLILEGSVQRAGDQLRITAQLINGTNDEHIWADSYDRSVEDLFSIQREVALAIARVLKAKLSDQETQSLNETPTDNIQAYQLYQRGVYLISSSHFNIEDWERAVNLFEEAIALDPNFVEAYARLAQTHARIYHLARDHSDERVQRTLAAAEKATKLAPSNPIVILSNGYVQLWIHSDREAALKYFEKAAELLPNNVDVLSAMASIYESQNKFDEYIEVYERAIEISPRDAGSVVNVCFGYFFTNQFEKGQEAVNRAMLVVPKEPWNLITRGFIHIAQSGANAASRAAFEEVDKNHSWYIYMMMLQNMGEENDEGILRLAEEFPNGVDTKMSRIPASSMKAFVYRKQNKLKEAKIEFQKSVDSLLADLENHSEDDRYHSALGIAYAGLGNKEKAIFHGIKGTELLPLSKDAFYGQVPLIDLALIYTYLGDFDKAFDIIEKIVSAPTYWNAQSLKDDFRYDALRADPRFEELIKMYPTTSAR
jgi:TolB-like protein/Tfp pilus assembly protein PilF